MRKPDLEKLNGVIVDLDANETNRVMGALELLGYSLSTEKDENLQDLTTITKSGVYVRGRVDSLKRLIEMLDILDDHIYERELEIKNDEIARLQKDCRAITVFADKALKEIIDRCGMCGVKDPLPCITHKQKFGGYSDELADPYRRQDAPAPTNESA